MEKIVSQRERNRLNRRATIVRVARQMFLDRGYTATPMSTVATALGGSKATLWKHFPSKADLFGAVLDDLVGNLRDELVNTLEPERDVRTTLLAFSHAFLDRMLAPESLLLARLVAGEAGRFPEVGTIFFEHAPRPVIQRLEGYFAQCIASGALLELDPRAMAGDLISLIQGVMYHQRLWNVIEEPAQDQRCRHVEATVETFWRAYGSR